MSTERGFREGIAALTELRGIKELKNVPILFYHATWLAVHGR